MTLISVKISDIQISDRSADTIITYSLGSCIGMTVYDPVRKVGGMLHYMLPQSKISPQKALENPAMFADTGIPLLIKGVLGKGGVQERLIVKIAGGSQLMDENKVFNIGERNLLMLRKIVWHYGLLIKGQHVGGSMARTLKLDIGSGTVTVKTSKGDEEI